MVRVPPPAWAVLYVVVCAAISWLLGWPRVPGLPAPPLGMALIAGGAIPPVWAFALFRREGTEIEPTSPANRRLVTGGPFSFSRNPMYLGLVVITVGIAVWIGAWPMFVAPLALFATANGIHIPFEEAKMRRQFTSDFDAYTRRVRRWL